MVVESCWHSSMIVVLKFISCKTSIVSLKHVSNPLRILCTSFVNASIFPEVGGAESKICVWSNTCSATLDIIGVTEYPILYSALSQARYVQSMIFKISTQIKMIKILSIFGLHILLFLESKSQNEIQTAKRRPNISLFGELLKVWATFGFFFIQTTMIVPKEDREIVCQCYHCLHWIW